jgi:hypothetical protein
MNTAQATAAAHLPVRVPHPRSADTFTVVARRLRPVAVETGILFSLLL